MQGEKLLVAGDLVAGYEVEKVLARGGFAVVYRARDVSLGRRVVALKVIAPELAGNDKFRQRFIRESEMAASIDHPNILPVYRAGEEHGFLYIAMRFIEGQDLGRILATRGSLPAAEVLPIFTQVAAALDVAHGHGLVHRDVKPGNILVGKTPGHDGAPHVYLADFGLTKRSSNLSGVATARDFIGTPAYSAPEQISGDAVNAQTDIYSLGCVIYEALTGRLPFQREEDMALLWAHVYTTPIPPSQLRSDLPTSVDAVLARALAKRPEDRHGSARALVSDLRMAFRQTPPTEAPLHSLPRLSTERTHPEPGSSRTAEGKSSDAFSNGISRPDIDATANQIHSSGANAFPGATTDRMPIAPADSLSVYVTGANDKQAGPRLARALIRLAELEGVPFEASGDPVHGSWWQRFRSKFSGPLSPEARRLLEKVEMTAQASLLDLPMSEANSAYASAFAEVTRSLSEVEDAVVVVGSMLFVKHTNSSGSVQIMSKNLAPTEMLALERNPHILTSPVAALAHLQDLGEKAQPSPALSKLTLPKSGPSLPLPPIG